MERINFDDQISRNKWKSISLIVIIFLVFLLLGYVISMFYSEGVFFLIMIISIIVSLGYITITYYNSDKIALSSVNAKEAKRADYPQLYHSVEGLTIASGLPMPKIYVMQNDQINAFASGRDPKHAVICLTTGAIKKLNKQELEGVIAHELSHIANYDIRFMTLTAVMVGMIAIISELFLRSLWFSSGDRDSKGGAILLIAGIILAILAPIAVKLVQLAISRKREFVADASAVKFTRYPNGLIHALSKIKDDQPMKVNKAVASLFMSDPFRRKVSGMFSTHPDIGERIKILRKM
ncbi:MAG: M48 family metallopeptidase [Nanoarchaeota archaeon]|nr:M48 family metallopeptidase [Nanoarchaeota archaeon]